MKKYFILCTLFVSMILSACQQPSSSSYLESSHIESTEISSEIESSTIESTQAMIEHEVSKIEMISGIDSIEDNTWTIGAYTSMKLTTTCNSFRLLRLEIDGETIDSSIYKTTTGFNMAITLEDDYLDHLSIGEHIFTVICEDGSASTTLPVKQAENLPTVFEGYVEYPDIDTFNTFNDKLFACSIPHYTTTIMTDEQLAQAVADFPLFYEVFMTGLRFAPDKLSQYSDAYRELRQREGAKDALISKMKELEEQGDMIAFENIRLIVKHDSNFKNTFTEEEKEFLHINN